MNAWNRGGYPRTIGKAAFFARGGMPSRCTTFLSSNWMSDSTHIFQRATELPEEWDDFCLQVQGTLFLRRQMLALLEETNPGERRYFLIRSEAGPSGISVAYALALNPLTYLGPWARVRLWIVGIPCSVSEAGFHAVASHEGALLEALKCELRFFLILNLRHPLPGMRAAATLPDVRMPIRFASFQEYWESLRSPYRRWLRRSMIRTSDLYAEVCAPSPSLGAEIHPLYRSVYARSRYKLECQGPGFFARFPGKILLLRRGASSECLAFALLACEGGTLSFVFCGFRRGRDAVAVYVRLLAELVRYAIEQRVRLVSLGQTAEESKLRLGGVCEPRYMQVGCRWRWLEGICGAALGPLGYRGGARQRAVLRKGAA